MDIQTRTSGPLTYYLTARDPSVLIVSGIHGDEYGAGTILEDLMLRANLVKTSFLYVPRVSPSAVAAHTRTNIYHHDVNREFKPNTTDAEAQTIMSVLRPYHVTLAIDVHEDPERTDSVYVYDTGNMSETEQQRYRARIIAADAKLFTGMDDSEDKDLGCHIEKGYISFRQDTVRVTIGFLSIWMTSKKIADRVFTVEIPGKASNVRKKTLLLAIIRFLVTTFGVQ